MSKTHIAIFKNKEFLYKKSVANMVQLESFIKNIFFKNIIILRNIILSI